MRKYVLFLCLISFQPSQAFQIVYFGDSQAALEMGTVAADFYEEVLDNCSDDHGGAPEFIGFATASSSFHHWVQSSGPNKRLLCGREQAVSALVLGNGLNRESVKQNGHFPDFQPEVCRSGQSAMDSVFDLVQHVDFVIANFMGNSAYRSVRVNGRRVVQSSEYRYELLPKFANTEFDLSKDLKQFLSKLPDGVPCLVMTTNPNRASDTIRRQRIHAQAVIRRDIEASGRCAYLDGVTPETEQVFRDNPDFLIDRFHISAKGSRWFLNHHKSQICALVRGQF